jgi:aminoglycoside phosphotransferase
VTQHITENPASDLLRTAARLAGLDSSNATLIRDGSNTIFQLSKGIVARIGRPGTSARAAREVEVSRWIASQGIPVVATVANVPQNLVVNDRPVTWWMTVPSHRPATPAELARVLRALHSLPTPTHLSLPTHDPFAGFDEFNVETPVLQHADKLWLRHRIAQLRTEYHDTTIPKVLHGDAWQGNVAVAESGEIILLDLENVSVGRQHWDLVQVAADHTDFARITDDEYLSFVESYDGFDVTQLADYRILADIAELRWTCFALMKAATSSKAAHEARHRIACLRGEYPRPWTWNAL